VANEDKNMVRCPGQDQRFWKPEDIFEVRCPGCGQAIEFFKDEPKLKCRKCGQMVVNPKIDLGCAQWCQYADQCLGITLAKGINVVRDKLIDEMKNVFAGDTKRIDHALAVLNYAEQIQAAEGGDPLVVKAGAILHDIGIGQAERKHGSAAAKYHQIEGPIIARAILAKYDLGADDIEHICRIIAGHHSARDIDTTEFRVVWDADRLVNIAEDFAEADKPKLKDFIDKTFKTCTGRQIAVESFIKSRNDKSVK
jgi:putative nucleotidyltransferase with HDIG domain